MTQDESRDPTGRDSARLQLLAHVYSAHVTHLTTGMRIGASPPAGPLTTASLTPLPTILTADSHILTAHPAS